MPEKINPIKTAKLLWRNKTTPFSATFDDVYFSERDGAAESRYVFLQNNHLSSRFQTLFDSPDKNHFTIAETGFGTGLNFLQSCVLWQEQQAKHSQNNGKKLYFISTEIQPLSLDDLKASLACWPEIDIIAKELIANYPPPVKGMHTLEFSHGITLILIFDDVIAGLKQCQEHNFRALKNVEGRSIDAWFLDGFSPAKNPDMWSDELFSMMATLSHRKTTLATFTAAGFVKRGLMRAGFRVKKVKGFGKKREMITAAYQGLPETSHAIKPTLSIKPYHAFWPIYRPQPSNPQQKTAIVIGAGIAGYSTAKALADSGIAVTLLDKNTQPMQEASGNMQGVLFPKLSHQMGHLAQFNLYSFLYAQRFYQQAEFSQAFYATGMLQLINENKIDDADALIDRFHQMPELVQKMDAKQASQLAGTTINQPCLWYPSTGWFRQKSIKDAFAKSLQHGVDFHGDTEANQLHFNKNNALPWTVNANHCLTGKQLSYRADYVILCNAFAANNLLASLDNDRYQLPLKNIRGQITQVDNLQLPPLKTTICHQGYITPADTLSPKAYNFGASYELKDDEPGLQQTSQDKNIHKLSQHLSEFDLSHLKDIPLKGRTAFRCTAPDYLPIIGPVPNPQDFQQRYKNLAKTAKAFIPETGHYYDGLMLNIGLGSRGFASAPLAAAIIRSYCLEQPFPISPALIHATHPARFLMRDIIRRRG